MNASATAFRTQIEAAFPHARGYLDQHTLEQRLGSEPDHATALQALDAIAKGRWILVCGQAFAVSVPDGGARAAWRPEDSFRLALRGGGRSAFEIEFAGVPGVNRAELVLAKRVTCVLARYNGGGKASPGHLVQPPLDGARD